MNQAQKTWQSRTIRICCGYVLIALLLPKTSMTRFALASERDDRLPEGNSGLVSKYPGDAGIEKDPQAIFVENFDAGSLQEILNKKRWESVNNRSIMSLSDGVPEASADKRSPVRFVQPLARRQNANFRRLN